MQKKGIIKTTEKRHKEKLLEDNEEINDEDLLGDEDFDEDLMDVDEEINEDNPDQQVEENEEEEGEVSD
jgi:hypothetical protein